MTIPENISLPGFFGIQLLQTVPGGTHGNSFSFGGHVQLLSFMYTAGAVLTRAMADRLTVLAPLLVTMVGAEPDIGRFRQRAADRLSAYVSKVGENPHSFNFLVTVTEWGKLGYETPLPGGRKSGLGLVYWERMSEVGTWRVPIADSEPLVKAAFLEGCGFGIIHPELTELAYRNQMEHFDAAEWSQAQEMGVLLSGPPTVIDLEEYEETILGMLALYCDSYRPELIDELNLSAHLKSALG